MGVDSMQLLDKRSQLGNRHFVELDTVNARLHQPASIIGTRLDKQLFLDAASTNLGQKLNKRIESRRPRRRCHKPGVVVEHQHGLGKAHAMRKRSARNDRLGQQISIARRALSRRQHLAHGIGRMRSVDHFVRLGCHSRVVVEHI